MDTAQSDQISKGEIMTHEEMNDLLEDVSGFMDYVLVSKTVTESMHGRARELQQRLADADANALDD